MNFEFLEKPLIRYPLYVGFSLLMFVIFMVLTFPSKRVRDIAVVQMETALDHKYDVEIDKLGLWWLMGVELDGLTLTERMVPDPNAPTKEETGFDPPEAMKVRLERVGGRFAPLSSLFNMAPTVYFRVDVGGGGLIKGQYFQSSSRRNLTVDLDSVDLRKSTLLTSLLGVPFFGVLDGDMEFEFHPTSPVVTGGHIQLDGKQLTVGPATIQTDKFPPMTYFEIPQTNFGTLNARLAFEPGQGEQVTPNLIVEKFETAGRDIRSEMWGDVTLGHPLGVSRPKLEMRLQFDEGFVTKNSLGPLLNVNEFRAGKAGNWFGFVLWGTLGNLRFKGAATAARGPQEAVADAGGADEK